MAPDIVVRPGQASDSLKLVQILAGAPQASQCTEGYPVLVAELGGEVVGFAVYRIVAGEGEVLNLAVDTGSRRCGIGSRLLAALLPKAEIWHLEVRDSNHAAIRLYETFGFETVGRRVGYYRDGEDARLLSRFHVQAGSVR